MSSFDHYTPEQLRKGISDLMYFLAHPALDAVIWRVQEDSDDLPATQIKSREESASDFRDEGESSQPEIVLSDGKPSSGNETCGRPCRGCAHRYGERLRYRVGWRHR